MCANNYLGLADHPALIAAAKEALDSHGFGMASVRFICGTQDIHKQLEAKPRLFRMPIRRFPDTIAPLTTLITISTDITRPMTPNATMNGTNGAMPGSPRP